MSAASDLRELSEPWERGDKIKAAIARAAKRSGLSYWRVFDIWYGKARRVEQFEYAQIAEALDNKRTEAARNEFHELAVRMARLESLLVQTDPDFHRENIAALRDQVRRPERKGGGQNRTLDQAKPA